MLAYTHGDWAHHTDESAAQHFDSEKLSSFFFVLLMEFEAGVTLDLASDARFYQLSYPVTPVNKQLKL